MLSSNDDKQVQTINCRKGLFMVHHIRYSEKTIALLTFTHHQSDSDKNVLLSKMSLRTKVPNINKQMWRTFRRSTALTEYSNDMNDVYANVNDYNSDWKTKK